MSEYKPGLPPALIAVLLGSIATSRESKPNDVEVRAALVQLAEAAAAIIKAMPKRAGLRDHFFMQVEQALERRSPIEPTQDEEE